MAAAPAGTGLLCDPLFLRHWIHSGHPESPHRYQAIMDQIRTEGLFRRVSTVAPFTGDVEQCLRRIHSVDHINSIKRRYGQSGDVAIAAVRSALAATHAVGTGEVRNAFCVTRPPGHHALNTGRVEGFCYFSTVAVAARYAQQELGMEKVLIVDWDYHHGNGTEAAFYADPSVLFFSTHDYHAYPGTGDPARVGEKAGTGYNINVHLDCGANDADITTAFDRYLLPAVEKFRPDIVLVSAGFDSRRDDPLGCFSVSDDGFTLLTDKVTSLADQYCQGRLVSVLEGGYNLQGLATASTAHLHALLRAAS